MMLPQRHALQKGIANCLLRDDRDCRGVVVRRHPRPPRLTQDVNLGWLGGGKR